MRACLVLSLLLLACSAGRLEGQISCREEETLGECWKRLSSAGGQASEQEVEAAVEATVKEAAERVAAKTSGIPALGPGLASALQDFLPIFAGGLGLTQTTTEDGGAAFETNVLLPIGATTQRVKLQALLRKPGLYEPLADALSAPTSVALKDSLEDELADFDDVRVTAAWNLENGSFGRSFPRVRSYYGAYFSQIVRGTLDRSETQKRLRAAYMELLAALNAADSLVDPALAADTACAEVEIHPDTVPLACIHPDERARVDSAVSQAARLVAARAVELRSALADQGFYEFTGLVNNQPQLQVELNIDLRRDLVGPNQWGIRVRYEGGFSNVNTLRGYCQERGLSPMAAACLTTYLNSGGHRAAIRRGDRFALAAEFGRTSDYALTSPVALTQDGTWHLSGTATIGRYLAVSPEGDEIGRIDLSSSYIYYPDDPERNDRFLFSATYTQRLTDALSLAAGVSYASEPEFLEEVDKNVSANFGLRYKFLRD